MEVRGKAEGEGEEGGKKGRVKGMEEKGREVGGGGKGGREGRGRERKRREGKEGGSKGRGRERKRRGEGRREGGRASAFYPRDTYMLGHKLPEPQKRMRLGGVLKCNTYCVDVSQSEM